MQIEETFEYPVRDWSTKRSFIFVDHTSDGMAIYRDKIGIRVITTREKAHAMAKRKASLYSLMLGRRGVSGPSKGLQWN